MTYREKIREFNEIKEFFDFTCVKCEGASGLANVERDHIVPKYQGGADMPHNFQPLCAKCNASKGPDSTDYRLIYCQKHNLTMPKKWMTVG